MKSAVALASQVMKTSKEGGAGVSLGNLSQHCTTPPGEVFPNAESEPPSHSLCLPHLVTPSNTTKKSLAL